MWFCLNLNEKQFRLAGQTWTIGCCKITPQFSSLVIKIFGEETSIVAVSKDGDDNAVTIVVILCLYYLRDLIMIPNIAAISILVTVTELSSDFLKGRIWNQCHYETQILQRFFQCFCIVLCSIARWQLKSWFTRVFIVIQYQCFTPFSIHLVAVNVTGTSWQSTRASLASNLIPSQNTRRAIIIS